MQELFIYEIEKKEKEISGSLKLLESDRSIVLYSDFNMKQIRKKNYIRNYIEMEISKKTGDFSILYRVENSKLKRESFFRTGKNQFDILDTLSFFAIWNGWKSNKIWGVKYKKKIESLLDIIFERLCFYSKDERFKNTVFEKNEATIFKMICDFHFSMKNIKTHDNIYEHVLYGYPKLKYLKSNENKFLPALLDEMGIRSNFLISELSKPTGSSINIKTLSSICLFFGENYFDYLKKFNWIDYSSIITVPPKFKKITDETDKRDILNLFIENDQKSKYNKGELLELLFTIYEIKYNLNKKGYKKKIRIKNLDDIERNHILLVVLMKEIKLGYKYLYSLPMEFKREIEQPIITDLGEFTPRLLLSESDFTIEGMEMKNCMGRQFINGSINIFLSLSHETFSKINIQYDKGVRFQTFGKANTPILDEFKEPLSILDKKMKKYSDITWKKVKQKVLF